MKKNKKLSQLNDAPLNQPQNRTERFLAKIARLADTAPADTRTRLERYLAAIVQSTAGAGTISADTETTVEGILFGNSTTGKVEGIVPEMSAQDVADYLEAVEEAVTAGGVVNSSQLNKWQSNPNLLDNWYFVGGGSQQGGGQFPINQRGQTSYSGEGYGIDRWKVRFNNISLVVNDGYISLIAEDDLNAAVPIGQYVELPPQMLGQTVTVSAIFRKSRADLPLRFGLSNISDAPSAETTDWQFSSYTAVVNQSAINDKEFVFVVDFNYRKDDRIDILAAKLELGDTQTLAHQENGVWVLNEVPNYQEQLARCQRYQREVSDLIFTGFPYSQTNGRITATFYPPLRTNPTVDFSRVSTIDVDNVGIGAIPCSVYGNVISRKEGVSFDVETLNNQVFNQSLAIISSDIKVMLDANL